MNRIDNTHNRHILFLQGPMGFFFKKVDSNFKKRGAITYKIGLNAGDYFFSNKNNYTPYRDRPERWESFISHFLDENMIEIIFLFGDCRFYQKIARKVAYAKKIDVYVFEEGYLRPDYITLEKFGVNNFSTLPRKREFYENISLKEPIPAKAANPSKSNMIFSAIAYYGLANLGKVRYPFYQHHRDFSAFKEAFYGVRALFRKIVYSFTERKYRNLFTDNLSKQYYFVPLQTFTDFQVLQHSSYKSVEKFIIEVLESFAKYAPEKTYLLFKHHPVDRGRKNYESFIREQASLLNIENRVLSIHDVYLPDCIKHSIATITINSTVGLSAIAHNIPTFVLGSAIYDIEGLTNKGMTLEQFWHDHKKPDSILYLKFKQYLIGNTQLNGSFYGRMPEELS